MIETRGGSAGAVCANARGGPLTEARRPSRRRRVAQEGRDRMGGKVARATDRCQRRRGALRRCEPPDGFRYTRLRMRASTTCIRARSRRAPGRGAEHHGQIEARHSTTESQAAQTEATRCGAGTERNRRHCGQMEATGSRFAAQWGQRTYGIVVRGYHQRSSIEPVTSARFFSAPFVRNFLLACPSVPTAPRSAAPSSCFS